MHHAQTRRSAGSRTRVLAAVRRRRSRARITAAIGHNKSKVGSCIEIPCVHNPGHQQIPAGPGYAQSPLVAPSLWLMLRGITVPARRKRQAATVKLQRASSDECCPGPPMSFLILQACSETKVLVSIPLPRTWLRNPKRCCDLRFAHRRPKPSLPATELSPCTGRLSKGQGCTNPLVSAGF